jgi:predicted MFS family arabinose efflux permease
VNLPILIFVTILSHTAFNGSRITVSLYAHHLHASTFTIGMLMSLYAVVPMFLSVKAGRWVDRVGARGPMGVACVMSIVGLVLPSLFNGLGVLYVACVLIGTGFMILHVAVNQTVGAVGGAEGRAARYSWLALGFSTSGFLGPVTAGLMIDSIGHPRAMLASAALPLLAMALLWWKSQGYAAPNAPASVGDEPAAKPNVFDLIGIRDLRHVFIVTGLLSMGWDLYMFVMPIYCAKLGLSASTIGFIMGSFAAATFAVRLGMPFVVNRLREWHLITFAFMMSGVAFSIFPLFEATLLLAGVSFFLGIGLGCAQPMVMNLLYTTAPAGRTGEAVGVRSTILNASHTFLPLLFGAMGASLGMAPVFLAMAGFLAAGGVFAIRKAA